MPCALNKDKRRRKATGKQAGTHARPSSHVHALCSICAYVLGQHAARARALRNRARPTQRVHALHQQAHPTQRTHAPAPAPAPPSPLPRGTTCPADAAAPWAPWGSGPAARLRESPGAVLPSPAHMVHMHSMIRPSSTPAGAACGSSAACATHSGHGAQLLYDRAQQHACRSRLRRRCRLRHAQWAHAGPGGRAWVHTDSWTLMAAATAARECRHGGICWAQMGLYRAGSTMAMALGTGAQAQPKPSCWAQAQAQALVLSPSPAPSALRYLSAQPCAPCMPARAAGQSAPGALLQLFHTRSSGEVRPRLEPCYNCSTTAPQNRSERTQCPTTWKTRSSRKVRARLVPYNCSTRAPPDSGVQTPSLLEPTLNSGVQMDADAKHTHT